MRNATAAATCISPSASGPNTVNRRAAGLRRHRQHKAHRHHSQRADNCLGSGTQAGRIDDRQHSVPGASVVGAIQPGDRHEMWELPEEHHADQRQRAHIDRRSGGGPADQNRQRTADSADSRIERRTSFERRVNEDVNQPGGERRSQRSVSSLPSESCDETKHQRELRRTSRLAMR